MRGPGRGGSLRYRWRLAAVVVIGQLLQPMPSAADDCGAPAQAELLMRQAEVLLLGALHGTREAPQLLEQLACTAVRQGHVVVVGLEMPRTMRQAIDDYIQGEGSREEKIALLEEPFWQRGYQDGRSSLAMFELLEAVRALRSEEAEIHVVPFDVERRELDRDRSMAMEISRAAGRGADRVLVLVGSAHARLDRGRAPDTRAPLGFHLGMMSPGREIVSLNLTHSGGTVWTCDGESALSCGQHRIGGAEAPMGLELFSDDRQHDYTGRWHLGVVSASPPAKRAAR